MAQDKISIFKDVLETEANAILRAKELVQEGEVQSLIQIFEHLENNCGQLVFCGVGKSGHIALKLASTFTSLGLPSIFLHPTEALHGDLGRVRENDSIVFISKSGTAEEISRLIPFIKIPKSRRIGLFGNMKAPLMSEVLFSFDCSVEKEACLNNQAPTTSSTLAMAMGDAMAVVYEKWAGLSKEGFAKNHPGGILGKSLSLRVKNLMISKDGCPSVSLASASLKDVIIEMTAKPVGGCVIIEESQKISGLVVEGDIRRAFTKTGNSLETSISEVMTKKPMVISENAMAYEALELMEGENRHLTLLPVVNEGGKFVGMITLHQLVKEGFVSSK